MANKKLTIIGATGFLSTTITRQLVNDGVTVRVVARNPENAKKILPDSVEIVGGDVSDKQSLITALKGTDALYIHLNTETTDMNLPFYTEREGVQNIVEAAKANKVKHIMQIAGLESLHDDFFLNGTIETREIREAGMKLIEDSGIPYTFFYCSFFADSFIRFVDNNALYLFGDLPHKIFFTNSFQLARHIHQAIENPRALNQKYPVQGHEAMTFQEATQRFFMIYDPEVSVQKLPLETVNELGLPATEAAFLRRIWEVCGGLDERFVSAETYEHLGQPLAGIDELARQIKNS
ncbi:NAD(P)H-binding protein [Thalassomonas viridans]|uniref:NAD(P)H-binding protein n=1 Tax=Thalassomonas viridans TaxID=137584 RepID=A0AAE9Z9L1_9GAMM|nr:NAD(P)H-binding protein [Thalassomonas viridans]WDE07838.1 NAD(P)H-binding protein [Thalassomonas viridans]